MYDRLVTEPSDQITIVPAREASLEDVNGLIARSKAYWDWPEEYLSRAIPLHRITSSYLSSNRCFEVVTNHGELVGFLSITEGNARIMIDNLWIAPEHIRHGIGSAAVHFVFELARAYGWRHLWVLPEPPAEGFYRALGFSDTGERVPSRVSGGPVFSVYRIPAPELPATAYEHRVKSVLQSLGISPESLRGRSLLLCEEAKELVVAEIDRRGRVHQLLSAAAFAWREMKAAASAQGITLQIVSAFRSVDRQVEIIHSKLQAGVPLEQILAVNAPPGYSEHHTGRAVDITTPGATALAEEFEGTTAFRWLSEYGHSFRYFLSYPRNNRQGYSYEPWHWCYKR